MHIARSSIAVTLALLCAAGCAGMNKGSAVESRAVLDRPTVAESAEVKHILLGYSWLSSRYRQMGMQLDPRAEQRNETATEQLAAELLGKLRAGAPIEPLMAQYSEDPGSAKDGKSYTVDPSAKLVEPFKQLSLRLQPGESGIVRSDFGYHVVKRVR
jgi:hypothetical protein